MMIVPSNLGSTFQPATPRVVGLELLLRQVLLALAYAGASGFGQLLAFLPPGNVTAVFPASGVALAAVLLGGPRYAIGIWLGSFLGNLAPFATHGQPFTGLACAAFVGLGAAAQSVFAADLFRRATGATDPFGRARDAGWFVAAAALAGSLVGATFGTAVLFLTDLARQANAVEVWLTWWLGDASGVLLIAPLVLAWSKGGPTGRLGRQLVELAALFALPLAVCAIVITSKFPIEYLYLPLLTWAALRFGKHGATALAALIAAVAVLTSISDLGSFLGSSRNESLLLLQAFLGTIGTSTLLLLGVIAQRDAAEHNLERINETLEMRVEERMTELAEMNRRLVEMANRDPLTNVANRRCFDEALENEWRRCGRAGLPLAVVLMDLDSFKAFNDTYGHPAGDECLRRIGFALAENLQRSGELLARYGGEEFVALLPGVDLDEAYETAERLRQTVLECAIPHAESATGPVVSLSAGVSAAIPTMDGIPMLLVTAADAALYVAKRAGRNRVSRPTEVMLVG